MSDAIDTVRAELTALQARVRPRSSAAYIEALPDDDAYKIAVRALAALAVVEADQQRADEALRRCDQLLWRLGAWDHMQTAADGPYWLREINQARTEALAALGREGEARPQEPGAPSGRADAEAAAEAVIDGVLDLMREASRSPADGREPGAIRPESNGYGCWFTADDDPAQMSARALTAREIRERIEARAPGTGASAANVSLAGSGREGEAAEEQGAQGRCRSVCRATRDTCALPATGPHRCVLPVGHSGKHNYHPDGWMLTAEQQGAPGKAPGADGETP